MKRENKIKSTVNDLDKEVDLVLFHFLPISYFLVQFIFLFLFLAPRVRVSDNIGHIARKVLEG